MSAKIDKTKVPNKESRYFEAVGRRKTAVARVRLWRGSTDSETVVNGKSLVDYFPLKKNQNVVQAPLTNSSVKIYRISAKVAGGGPTAQAEAIRLGIARTLILYDAGLRPKLKAVGYLRRDPRMVERKKYGLRKARRPQQWRKR